MFCTRSRPVRLKASAVGRVHVMQIPARPHTGPPSREQLIAHMRPALHVLRQFEARGLFKLKEDYTLTAQAEELRELAWKYYAESTEHMGGLLRYMTQTSPPETGDGLSDAELARVLNTTCRVLCALLLAIHEKDESRFIPRDPTLAGGAVRYGLDSEETMRSLYSMVLGKLNEMGKFPYGITPDGKAPSWFL